MDWTAAAEPRPSPRQTATPASALFFWWTAPLFREGYRRDFTPKDLHDPLPADRSQLLGDRLEGRWHEQLWRWRQRHKAQQHQSKQGRRARPPRTPSLARAVLAAFLPEYALLGAAILAHGIISGVVQPLLLGRLLDYFEHDSGVDKRTAYAHGAGIVLATAVNTLLYSHYSLGTWRLGMRLRAACCSLVYRKALRLSQTALGETPPGQLVNLLSNDVSRFEKVTTYLHYLWLSPILAASSAYFMYSEVGWPAFVGFGAIFLVLPLQGYMSHLTAVCRSRTAFRTDTRVRLIDDIISGIHVIKMYTWEKPFSQIVYGARKLEIDVLSIASYIRGIYMTLSLCTTRTAFFCTMVSMVMFHQNLTGRKVFVLQSYFNVLAHAVSTNFVRALSEAAEVVVSLRRLQDFMLLEEFRTDTPRHRTSTVSNCSLEVRNSVLSEMFKRSISERGGDLNDRLQRIVVMKGVSAKWESHYTDPTLNNVNLSIARGSLTTITGPVGSGKTSLLQAILGELPTSEGSILVHGSLSYASQQPWVFAATVRQNIVFGRAFDRARYERVVRACALERDLSQLPCGDQTVVGEHGASLSGGQKARINLARAVYNDVDIYLLDDPLSAVDSNVSSHLFQECICKFLVNKTRILITHQLQYLQEYSTIVVMDNGKLMLPDVKHIRKLSAKSKLQNGDSTPLQTQVTVPSEDCLSLTESSYEDKNSTTESKCEKYLIFEAMESSSKDKIKGKSVFQEYLCSGCNMCSVVTVVALFILTQVLVSGVDYFVSLWTTQEEIKNQHLLQNEANKTTSSPFALIDAHDLNIFQSMITCIYIYTGLIVSLFLISMIRSIAFYKICMVSSLKLHEKMLNSLIQTHVCFFDANPSGRILNRFSKDMGSVDEVLPRAMLNTYQVIMQMIGCIIVSVMVNYYFAVPVVLIGAIFWFSQTIYLKTSNNIKRVEGITKSPVFIHLHATMKGLTTIRAYGAQEILIKEFDHHQDLHTAAWYTFVATSTAFGFFLDFFVLIFISIITLGSLLLEGNFAGVFGGHVGLAITQSMSLSGMLQWGVRQSAEVSNNMMSVERVLEYACLKPESNSEAESAPYTQHSGTRTLLSVGCNFVPAPEEAEAPPEWPQHGRIEFLDLTITRAEGGLPVISDLTAVIEPGQKVGIVGRTGAGKSSLVAALFRMCWHVDGRVLVDGLDASGVPLQQLRRSISIIPQDPVMFAGSMRKNLDPFDEYPDFHLLRVLEEVELRDALHDTQGLNTRVTEGGSNFSVGQRQLVCLARAILRDNKILVLDEATASVDHKTDALIQRTIRIKFKHCTVLTVAHRIDTVMDHDKILVIEEGKLVEFDHPHVLLQNNNGYLHQIVKSNPDIIANHLFKTAQQNFEKRLK